MKATPSIFPVPPQTLLHLLITDDLLFCFASLDQCSEINVMEIKSVICRQIPTNATISEMSQLLSAVIPVALYYLLYYLLSVLINYFVVWSCFVFSPVDFDV